MEPFAIAVKAFIVKDGKLLLLKRRDDAPDKPGTWDFPGGRLERGEDPLVGVQREAKEEAGVTIDVHHPLDISHFIRDDGQEITNIRFLCTTSDNVILGDEHTDVVWATLAEARELTPAYFHPAIDAYEKFFQKHI